ncbi:hypothetical protein HK102_007467, partial [Quaeritorhiza haematococci]
TSGQKRRGRKGRRRRRRDGGSSSQQQHQQSEAANNTKTTTTTAASAAAEEQELRKRASRTSLKSVVSDTSASLLDASTSSQTTTTQMNMLPLSSSSRPTTPTFDSSPFANPLMTSTTTNTSLAINEDDLHEVMAESGHWETVWMMGSKPTSATAPLTPPPPMVGFDFNEPSGAGAGDTNSDDSWYMGSGSHANGMLGRSGRGGEYDEYGDEVIHYDDGSEYGSEGSGDEEYDSNDEYDGSEGDVYEEEEEEEETDSEEEERMIETRDPLAMFAREGAELVWYNRLLGTVCERWFNQQAW